MAQSVLAPSAQHERHGEIIPHGFTPARNRAMECFIGAAAPLAKKGKNRVGGNPVVLGVADILEGRSIGVRQQIQLAGREGNSPRGDCIIAAISCKSATRPQKLTRHGLGSRRCRDDADYIHQYSTTLLQRPECFRHDGRCLAGYSNENISCRNELSSTGHVCSSVGERKSLNPWAAPSSNRTASPTQPGRTSPKASQGLCGGMG